MTTKTIKEAWDEFIASKIFLKGDDMPSYIYEDEDRKDGGYFYCNNNAYILSTPSLDTKYYLIIERDSYQSNDIKKLENILFTDFILPNDLIPLERED